MKFLVFLLAALLMGVLEVVVLSVTCENLRKYMEEVAAGEVFLICCVLSFAMLILVAW